MSTRITHSVVPWRRHHLHVSMSIYYLYRVHVVIECYNPVNVQSFHTPEAFAATCRDKRNTTALFYFNMKYFLVEQYGPIKA